MAHERGARLEVGTADKIVAKSVAQHMRVDVELGQVGGLKMSLRELPPYISCGQSRRTPHDLGRRALAPHLTCKFGDPIAGACPSLLRVRRLLWGRNRTFPPRLANAREAPILAVRMTMIESRSRKGVISAETALRGLSKRVNSPLNTSDGNTDEKHTPRTVASSRALTPGE
jgi:hypothetical protein